MLRRAALATAGAACLAGCGVRKAAPDFRYTLLDGRQADTRALRGKVVLVTFWATTCAPCMQEMPQLVATHEKFRAQGLETLAVAMSYDAPAAVAQVAESRQWPFQVVIDNTGAIAKAFGSVMVTPQTFVIDQQGRIVDRFVGAIDFKLLHRVLHDQLSMAA